MDIPTKIVMFHSYVNVYQRVNLHFPMVFLWVSHWFTMFPRVFPWSNGLADLGAWPRAQWALQRAMQLGGRCEEHLKGRLAAEAMMKPRFLSWHAINIHQYHYILEMHMLTCLCFMYILYGLSLDILDIVYQPIINRKMLDITLDKIVMRYPHAK